MPLTNGQVVLLPSGPLSFEDFAFFLDCKRSGKQEVCYISLDNGALQISRVRSRASEVRVNMGLACRVEVLRPEVEFVVDGRRLYPGENVRHGLLFLLHAGRGGAFPWGRCRTPCRTSDAASAWTPGPASCA